MIALITVGVLAGGAVAFLVGWALGARWRQAGRDLDRLSDLSDDSVDPDWPETREGMGDPDDEPDGPRSHP